MLENVKKFFSKAKGKVKALAVCAVASVSTFAMAAVASAASTDTSDTVTMKSMLSDAGTTLISSFNDLVQTMIPVVMGILGTSLVIFGVIALIKLAKKIFGKVAG